MPDLPAKVLFYFDKLRGTLEGIFTHLFALLAEFMEEGTLQVFKISPL